MYTENKVITNLPWDWEDQKVNIVRGIVVNALNVPLRWHNLVRYLCANLGNKREIILFY